VTLICAKFGKDLFSISKVIGRHDTSISRTDGRTTTTCRGIIALCVASRGKNVCGWRGWSCKSKLWQAEVRSCKLQLRTSACHSL